VIRGQRGDLIKVLRWTGDGLCLPCKRHLDEDVLEQLEYVAASLRVIGQCAPNSPDFDR
jgi:transposase